MINKRSRLTLWLFQALMASQCFLPCYGGTTVGHAVGHVTVTSFGCIPKRAISLAIEENDRVIYRAVVAKRGARVVALEAGFYTMRLSAGNCLGSAEFAMGPNLSRNLNVHLDDMSAKTAVAEDIFSIPGGSVVGSVPFDSVAVEAVDTRRIGRPAVISGRDFFFDSLPLGDYQIYVYGANWTLRSDVVVVKDHISVCHFKTPTGTSVGRLFEIKETACL